METSYKEKYEDILARLERAKYDNEVCDERFCCVIDEIIPELAESKDERIRKEIIEVIESLSLEKEYEYIAWLEKQGRVKESFISQHENRTCEENGNSLTSEDERIRKEIINYFQCQSEEEPTRKEIHNKWIAWLENIPYTIDHEKREGFHLGYKAALDYAGGFCEQKFEMKSAEESLGIDSDTYNKIVDECIFGEQEPEENKGNIGGISANWSEEDEINIYNIIHFLEEPSMLENNKPCKKIVIDWLKSLKGRAKPQWKPSDEQIRALKHAFNDGSITFAEMEILATLYEGLKSII